MRSLIEQKKKAIQLRKKGLSYGEIRKHVNVAKSSLSLWLKNIELKPEHKERLYTKRIKILALGPQSQKERRAREIGKIVKEAESEIIFPLKDDTLKLLGAALYWAEGSKSGLCQITNSDPHMITFMVKWFKKVFNIHPKNLKARINLYPQQNETDLKKFWSELTGIPVSNFGKSFVKPVSKGYKKNNLYYGTMRVEVPKSVNIKHRIFGWIGSVLKKDGSIDLIKRKWEPLQRIERSIPINLVNIRNRP